MWSDPGPLLSLSTQDYKCLCAAVTICITLVNIQTHRQTENILTSLYEQLSQPSQNRHKYTVQTVQRVYDCEITLYIIRWQTVGAYACAFLAVFDLTLTFDPLTPFCQNCRTTTNNTSRSIQPFFKLSLFNILWWQSGPKSRLLTEFCLVMTLTFDLLTSKYNQFISDHNCSKVVNLVKFPRAVNEIMCQHAHTLGMSRI